MKLLTGFSPLVPFFSIFRRILEIFFLDKFFEIDFIITINPNIYIENGDTYLEVDQ